MQHHIKIKQISCTVLGGGLGRKYQAVNDQCHTSQLNSHCIMASSTWI